MKKDEVKKPKNSSMAADEKQMKEHGDMMERMSTNDEVKDRGRRPDPKQHDKTK
ncbi:hypothetical protein LC040_19490 [Bacillus tianshenii]|nr:hypothetical protein LC040_19490 [Bacillus tianshenii]